MALLLFINKEQIDQVCTLVQDDMTEYLGYVPLIQEISQKHGDDCRFQIGRLREEDYTKTVQEYFSERVWIRMKEVAKFYGE